MPDHKHEWPPHQYQYNTGRPAYTTQQCKSCPVYREWDGFNCKWAYRYPKDWKTALITDDEVEAARRSTAEWVNEIDPDFTPPPHGWRIECVHVPKSTTNLPWELHASNGDNACFLEAFETKEEALLAADTVTFRA